MSKDVTMGPVAPQIQISEKRLSLVIELLAAIEKMLSHADAEHYLQQINYQFEMLIDDDVETGLQNLGEEFVVEIASCNHRIAEMIVHLSCFRYEWERQVDATAK